MVVYWDGGPKWEEEEEEPELELEPPLEE